MLLLSGCVTPSGSGRSIWRPSTLWGGDLTSKRENADARATASRDELLRLAQAKVTAAGAALDEEPNPSQPVQAASALVGGAEGDMARALGPLAARNEADARELGSGLATGSGEALAAFQKQADKWAEQSIKLSERLARQEAISGELADKLATAYRSEAELADKYRKQQFFLWGTIILLVAGCILVPGFASLALFVIRKLRSTVRQVGTAVEAYKVEHPTEAAALEAELSRRMDEANKFLIRKLRAEGSLTPA
jgi:hypothetical protein